MPTQKSDTTLEKTTIQPKHLHRSTSDRMIAGVCGGMAEYFGWDAAIIRLIFILIILLGGSGILAYLILWVIIPGASVSSKLERTIPAPTTQNTTEKNSKPIWGIALIGVGVLMLLQNFGIADLIQLNRTWPVLLIIVGFLIVTK